MTNASSIPAPAIVAAETDTHVYPTTCTDCGCGCDHGLEDNAGRPRCEDCDQAMLDDAF